VRTISGKWKCLWSVVGLTVITLTGLHASRAADPQDYFQPPGGRIIETPPLTWQEKEIWDKALSRDPPDCGGACHGPLGLREDEPFLLAAMTYASQYKGWLRTKREAAAALARGGQVQEYADQLEAGAARLSQAANHYTPAWGLYHEQLRARGVSPTRAKWIERLHGLYIP
jgi:hypothetical protein